MRRCAAKFLVLGLGLAAALAGDSMAGAQGQSIRLEMASQSNSGITGTATLTDIGNGRMRIEIRATNAGAGPQPAHIHPGSCAQLDATPRFNLTPVTNGTSTTEVDGTFQTLAAGEHAIHLHKSQEELAIYVACADIRVGAQAGGQAGGQAPSALPQTGAGRSAAPLTRTTGRTHRPACHMSARAILRLFRLAQARPHAVIARWCASP